MISLPLFGLITTLGAILFWGSEFYKKHSLAYISCIILAAPVAFFHLSDSLIYQELWNQIDLSQPLISTYNVTLYEPFYFGVSYLSKDIGINFFYFRYLAILSALLLKVIFIKHFSAENPVGLIYYMALLFSVDAYLIRGSLAGSLICIALYFLIAKKNLHAYIALIVVAAGFHVSALTALPLALVTRYRATPMTNLLLGTVIFLCLFLSFGHFAVTGLSILFPGDVYFVNKVTAYALSGQGEASGVLRGSVLIYTVIFFFCLWYRKVLSSSVAFYDEILFVMFYSLLFLVGFSDFSALSDRIFRLYAPSLCIGFSWLLLLLPVVQRFAGAILCTLFLCYLSFFNSVNYHTIFY